MASAEQSDFFENLNDLIKRALLVVDETSESVTSLFGGWRPDLLIDALSVREKKLLMCSTCHGVMRDAVFYGKDYTCKVCLNSEVLDSEFVNENTRCIINDLQIKCPLTEEGCDWTGAIETLTVHFPSCMYYPVPCPLECTVIDNNTAEPVITTLPRHEVESHVAETCPNKEINCDYCDDSIKSVEMNFHVSECKAFPLACPNNCINPHSNETTLVKRGEMNNHIELECANVKIDCPFLPHGCNVNLLKKDLVTHEQDSMPQHLRLINSAINNKLLEKNIEIVQLKTKIADDFAISAKLIQEFNLLLNIVREESKIESESRYNLLNDKFNAKLTYKFVSLDVSFQAQLAAKCNSIETLFNAKLEEKNDKIYTLEKQLAKLQHKHTKHDEEILQLNKIIKSINSINCFEWNITNIRANVFYESNLNSASFYAYQYKFHCSIVFKSFPRPTLYSHTYNDKTKYIQVYVYITQGQFDDCIKWPFSGYYRFTLINQKDSSSYYIRVIKTKDSQIDCFKKPGVKANTGWGIREFISSSNLMSIKYCQNDSIILRVEISLE